MAGILRLEAREFRASIRTDGELRASGGSMAEAIERRTMSSQSGSLRRAFPPGLALAFAASAVTSACAAFDHGQASVPIAPTLALSHVWIATPTGAARE